MTLEDEYRWKEFDKKVLEKSKNFNDYQKEILKALLDLYYEDRKNSILTSKAQAKLIESIINENKNDNSQ